MQFVIQILAQFVKLKYVFPLRGKFRVPKAKGLKILLLCESGGNVLNETVELSP